MATITAQDGTGDSTTPVEVDGWEPEAESGNIVTELIDGSIAVTTVGDRPRTGTLRLVYADDTTAETARLLLGRRTSFTLIAPDRPVVDMAFVRAGRITPAMHDEHRDLWVFGVGFQEIIP